MSHLPHHLGPPEAGEIAFQAEGVHGQRHGGRGRLAVSRSGAEGNVAELQGAGVAQRRPGGWGAITEAGCRQGARGEPQWQCQDSWAFVMGGRIVPAAGKGVAELQCLEK